MDARTAETLKIPVEVENLGEWTARARVAIQKFEEAVAAAEEAMRLLHSLPELRVKAGSEVAGSAVRSSA